MRILWLDEATRVGRFDDWLHTRFAFELKKSVDALFFYAPHMHEKIPEHTPIQYSPGILMKDIIKELDIDTIILNTRAAAYHVYYPKLIFSERDEGELCLPKDFKDVDCLKICIEEDFQYETDDRWHRDFGFKAVLQKHYVHTLKKDTHLPSIFFPFSVDTNVFKQVNIIRTAKIGFAGTLGTGNEGSNGSVYKPREMAIKEIGTLDRLAPLVSGNFFRIAGDKYINYLQQYMGYLSCGSIYNLTPAKMLEIMASGGVVFTNKTIGLDKLFPEDAYLTYAENGVDIKDKLNLLFDNKEYRDRTIASGLKCVKERHSHEIRIKELLEIIKQYA